MMGEPNFFLGLKIKQSANGTTICQQKYLKELLKMFYMKDAKYIDTSSGTSSKLDLDKFGLSMNVTMYK